MPPIVTSLPGCTASHLATLLSTATVRNHSSVRATLSAETCLPITSGISVPALMSEGVGDRFADDAGSLFEAGLEEPKAVSALQWHRGHDNCDFVFHFPPMNRHASFVCRKYVRQLHFSNLTFQSVLKLRCYCLAFDQFSLRKTHGNSAIGAQHFWNS